MEGPVQTAPLRPGEVAAALDWWRDAGVDLDFTDAPTSWLAVKDVPEGPSLPAAYMADVRPGDAAEAAAKAPPMLGGPPADWPQDLAAFHAWWLAEPSLDGGQVRDRVAPRGAAGARVLVLVPQPEAEDAQSGQLLSGPVGGFARALLNAMGIAEDEAYFAAALPRPMPLPDWPGLHAQGLGQILDHHLRLAAPQRIVAFGSVILPLLGHDPAQSSGISLSFHHDGGSIPLLSVRELGFLAGKPAAKARFWQQWLAFSA